jgi:hypothetical protein
MPRERQKRKCRGHNRDGSPCKNWALPGQLVCRMHGGAQPAARRNGERRVQEQAAREATATYGLPVEVDPHDALLQEVHRTAGHVAWLHEIVQAIAQDDLIRGVTKVVRMPDGTTRTEVEAAPTVWLTQYQKERDHLRKVCADAIRAGVEERLVRLEEEKAVRLAACVRGIVSDLGHDLGEERVRTIVRRRLMEAV